MKSILVCIASLAVAPHEKGKNTVSSMHNKSWNPYCQPSDILTYLNALNLTGEMLVGRKDGIVVMFSSIGLVRCYLMSRIGGAFVHQGQMAATTMLSRQARTKVTARSTNTIIGPDGAVDHGDGGDDSDGPLLDNTEMWDTWEFGSWKVWALYAL